MKPEGLRVCPKCGQKDDTASIEPLFLVTGASGSGKTTIYGPLARLLAGRCAVFDVDWLLDAAGVLVGRPTPAELPWAGFDQAWLAVAHGIAQARLPTVLLGPLTPARLEANTGRKSGEDEIVRNRGGTEGKICHLRVPFDLARRDIERLDLSGGVTARFDRDRQSQSYGHSQIVRDHVEAVAGESHIGQHATERPRQDRERRFGLDLVRER